MAHIQRKGIFTQDIFMYLEIKMIYDSILFISKHISD